MARTRYCSAEGLMLLRTLYGVNVCCHVVPQVAVCQRSFFRSYGAFHAIDGSSGGYVVELPSGVRSRRIERGSPAFAPKEPFTSSTDQVRRRRIERRTSAFAPKEPFTSSTHQVRHRRIERTSSTDRANHFLDEYCAVLALCFFGV